MKMKSVCFLSNFCQCRNIKNFSYLAIFGFGVFLLLILFWISTFNNNESENFDSEKYENLPCTNSNIPMKAMLKDLTTPKYILKENEKFKLTLKDLVVVTFASKNHLNEAIRSCDSFQQNPQFNETKFIMYFENDVSKEMQKLYSQLCPVATILRLNLTKYPNYVQNLKEYRFKPIYQTLTLKTHKAILNIDASVRFVKNFDFKDFIQKAIKQNPFDVTLLSSAKHNQFSTTHPSMFNCFSNINQQELPYIPQFQSGLILWISSKNFWKIMKKFVECGLNPNCMGPSGAEADCDYGRITKYPNKFSGCHRFDQSAINLILYEISNSTPSVYQWNYPGFIVEKSSKLLETS